MLSPSPRDVQQPPAKSRRERSGGSSPAHRKLQALGVPEREPKVPSKYEEYRFSGAPSYSVKQSSSNVETPFSDHPGKAHLFVELLISEELDAVKH